MTTPGAIERQLTGKFGHDGFHDTPHLFDRSGARLGDRLIDDADNGSLVDCGG